MNKQIDHLTVYFAFFSLTNHLQKLYRKMVFGRGSSEGRSCGVCYSYEDMIRLAKEKLARKKDDHTMAGKPRESAEEKRNLNTKNPSTSSSSIDSAVLKEKHPRHDCPIDKDQLGRFEIDDIV